MIICMFGTGITELFTNQWTDVLFKTVTDNALLILTFVASMQVLGRAFAAPVVHRLAPQGVLLISAVFSALGIYLLIHLHGSAIFIGAFSFGLGVAFFLALHDRFCVGESAADGSRGFEPDGWSRHVGSICLHHIYRKLL
jgi:hypothetical protein